MPNVLEVKSVQANSFKTLFESLKEILDDCNITFDRTGMRILAIDGAHVCLVHMKLEAGNFDIYHCPEPHIAGVNLNILHKLLKSVSPDDTITFFIDSDMPHELGIKIENSEQNTTTTYLYKMMEIDEKDMKVPAVEFSSVMQMPSLEFQNLCRYLKDLTDEIIITCVNEQLIISIEGDSANMKKVIRESDTDKGLRFITSSKDEVIHGRFPLRFLLMFTKATNLSKHIGIYLKNDFPMVIQYSIANLGELRFALSPRVSEDDEF